MSPFKLTKYCACHEMSEKPLRCFRRYKDDSTTFDDIPTTFEDKTVISHPPLRRPYSSRSWLKNRTLRLGLYLPKFHEILHPPRNVTLHLQQILRLPRKVRVHLDQVLCLPTKMHQFSWHLLSLGIYSLWAILWASILSGHLFSNASIHFSLWAAILLASILLASSLSWHHGIYSLSFFKLRNSEVSHLLINFCSLREKNR